MAILVYKLTCAVTGKAYVGITAHTKGFYLLDRFQPPEAAAALNTEN